MIEQTLPPPQVRMNHFVVGTAMLLLLLGGIWLNQEVSLRQATLFAVGSLLGLVLYHGQFGFASAYCAFLTERRGAGIRAQMVMLALACLLFFPALSQGTLFGRHIIGNIDPIGIALIVGAFLFGIGMQLGSGCASGTLYTVGGGSIRMLVTLVFFIVGSVFGTFHLPWWETMPHLPGISLLKIWGLAPTLLLNLIVFAGIYGITIILEQRRYGRLLTPTNTHAKGWNRVFRGTWPLLVTALALAVLNFVTLALAGKPWGITSGFALWGTKLLALSGVDVSTWPYWMSTTRAAQLHNNLMSDITSIMNIGIVLGAFLAAGLAGQFAPIWRIPLPSLLAAILGGLLMGYGARLAYGCNIGAYFSGIASASIHGWLWIVAALIGSYYGLLVRPLFGLSKT